MDLVKWFVEIAERRPLLGVVALLAGLVFLLGSYILTLQGDIRNYQTTEVRLRIERDSAFREVNMAELRCAQNTITQIDKANKELKEEIARQREENLRQSKLVSETSTIVKSNTKKLTRLKR